MVILRLCWQWGLICAARAALARASDAELNAVFWRLDQANVTDYEAQAMTYALQGLVNRGGGPPRLFFDTGKANMDFPGSDQQWRVYLSTHRGVAFDETVPASLCALVRRFSSTVNSTVQYDSDGYSIHLALTMAGIYGVLPVSPALRASYPCLGRLRVSHNLSSIAERSFTDKPSAYRWAIATLLPKTNRSIVFNADHYHNAVASQGSATMMSVDYPVACGGFIMNLSPLWVCDPLDCGPGGGRVATPVETELFVEVVSSSPELVSVWGWGDPEHAYTNITTHAGGVVFCTFSTPNLSFWARLGQALGSRPIRIEPHDRGIALRKGAVYITFETNEGDTPRILSSQFTGAWLSPNRGTIPVGWAADPLLGQMFPELWNFFVNSTTQNDTFVDGVDGAGYVFVHSLGEHARAYEARAGRVLAALGPGVVDVGVAEAKWPATTLDEVEKYARNARLGGGVAPAAFLNACGSSWGQPVNTWLSDGTPVINSVCHGPANDTSDGHYLYYYRDHLDPGVEPARSLANRIRWAADTYQTPTRPLFLLAFGGLGLYGGHDDVFLFFRRVMAHLEDDARFEVLGAHEMARLAREARAASL